MKAGRVMFNAVCFTLFMALVFVGGPVNARDFYPGDVVVQVISDSRGVVREYPVDSYGIEERSYIVANNGERYSIRIKNRSGERVGVVVAVDGRNIITGKKSWLKYDEAKYVLNPHSSHEYSGWRSGRNRINRFYFTDPGNSYADAWGDHSAMGVISVAVFPEKQYRPQPRYERNFPRNNRDHGPSGRLRGMNSPQSMKKSHPSVESRDAGTGYGEREWSPSRRVEFKPQRRPVLKKFIKYEWRETLCNKGIIDCWRGKRPRGNRFWPEEFDGFAPPPWRIR